MLPAALATILLGAIDADALQWRNAVVGAGGAVSSARTTLVSALIRGLKADGIWPLDRLFIWAGENSAQARRDLVTRSLASAANGPTFTANRGYAGDGLSAYLDTTLAASALTVATDTTMFIGQWLNVLGAADPVVTGSTDGTLTSDILGPYTDSKIYPRLGDASAAGIASAGGAGFYLAEKTASTSATVARNGVDLGSETIASGARSTASMYHLAFNNNGTAGTFPSSTTRTAALAIGGQLGATKRVALYNRLNTFLTAIGAN